MDQAILDKIEAFFNKCEVKTYAKGEIITLANQEPEGVSFLLEGIVEQYDITPQGNKTTVNMFKPNSFFPMSWAMNNVPNSFFFSALTKVKLKQADRAVTVEFLQQNPEVTYDLLSRVYRGTDALLRRLVIAASGIASRRLIFEIIIEAYRFGVQQPDGKTQVAIKQNTLASRSGLARETISREMHKLENDGLISRNKHELLVDIGELEELLDLRIQ